MDQSMSKWRDKDRKQVCLVFVSLSLSLERCVKEDEVSVERATLFALV